MSNQDITFLQLFIHLLAPAGALIVIVHHWRSAGSTSHFMRFWAFLPIYIVPLFENLTQIGNDWLSVTVFSWFPLVGAYFRSFSGNFVVVGEVACVMLVDIQQKVNIYFPFCAAFEAIILHLICIFWLTPIWLLKVNLANTGSSGIRSY